MRRLIVALIAVGIVPCALFACVDLFHSTSFETECDITPSACLPDSSAPTDAQTNDATIDFCSFDSPTAQQKAAHACAWLGACVGPLGNSAFGTCMTEALQVYDCSVRPSRPVKGDLLAYWQCLITASTCTDVTKCVYPAGFVQCDDTDAGSALGFIGCIPSEPNTRLQCPPGFNVKPNVAAENCIAEGRICVSPDQNETAACVASPSTGCGSTCTGTQLHDCNENDSGTDLGVDCKYFGAQSCTNSGGIAACVPSAGANCTPDASVGCSGTLATSCPTGIGEAISCEKLLLDCVTPEAGAPWDVARACQGSESNCSDSCDGNTVKSCARNHTYSVDCSTVGLGPCAIVSVSGTTSPQSSDTVSHAACSKPQ